MVFGVKRILKPKLVWFVESKVTIRKGQRPDTSPGPAVYTLKQLHSFCCRPAAQKALFWRFFNLFAAIN
jgi:hypothetical protein